MRQGRASYIKVPVTPRGGGGGSWGLAGSLIPYKGTERPGSDGFIHLRALVLIAMSQTQTATDEAQTNDPFAHFRGQFDDDAPLEEMWLGDQRVLMYALETAIDANAERIRRRRGQDGWDNNPAVDHVKAQRQRRFAKMHHRLTEAMD